MSFYLTVATRGYRYKCAAILIKVSDKLSLTLIGLSGGKHGIECHKYTDIASQSSLQEYLSNHINLNSISIQLFRSIAS